VIETPSGEGRSVDVSHAQGVQVGEHNRQVNYVTQVVDGRMARPPRITVYGEIESPYMGLNAFSEDDAAFFFGRDQAIEDVLSRLAERVGTRVPLLVSGASGAGKSSLLRAGVLPRLAAAGLPGLPGARAWRRVTFTPARAPLAELAAAIAPLTNTDAATLRRSLTADPRGFADIVHSITAQSSRQGPVRLILLVDQFEQVFTQGADAAERDGFIAALHAAATTGHGPAQEPAALVMLSGRADFESRFAEHEELAQTVQSRYLVTPMTERQLRLAVTGPAETADAAVEPRLADELVRAARGSGSAVLPHLSHALDQAWRHRADDDMLRLEDYDRAGGLEGSIRASADLAYASLTDAQKTAARPVFMHLVKVSSDLAVSAGRATRSELSWGQPSPADVQAVVEVFAAERLLTVDSVFVEISHEVLLVAWGTLRGWLDGDRIDLAQYSRLTADAYDWESRGRPASYLYPPGRLAEVDAAARRWDSVPGRYPALGPAARDYLAAARRAALRARARRRGAITGLSVLTVAAVTAATIASFQTAAAHHQAVVATSRQEASESLTLAQSDPLAADTEAVKAWHTYPTSQAASAMTSLLARQENDGALPVGPPDSTIRTALSPDGTILATVDQQTRDLRLFSTVTGKPAGAPVPLGPTAAATGSDVAFSPNGRLLAVLSTDRSTGKSYVRLWNPATRTEVRALAAPPSIARVAFSAGGTTLVAADTAGDIYQWNPATGQPAGPTVRTGETNPVMAVSPDGRLVAETDGDTEGIWNLATGRPAVRPWKFGGGQAFGSLAFSPDGRLLASAAGDTIQLRRTASGQPASGLVQVGKGNGSYSAALAFSPDGKTLISADSDSKMVLLNLAAGRQAGVLPEASPDSSDSDRAGADLSVSPGTGLLAGTDSNGTVQLWNLAGRQPVGAPQGTSGSPVKFSTRAGLLAPGGDGYVAPTDQVLSPDAWTAAASGVLSANGQVAAQRYQGQVLLVTKTGSRPVPADPGSSDLALSPDGALLATSNPLNRTIRLWNTATGAAAGPPLSLGDRTLQSLAFGPGGRTLAVGYYDGTVQLWNPARGSMTRTLSGATGTVVEDLAFSPDGQTLAAATGDRRGHGKTVLWNSSTGSRLGTLDPGTNVGTEGNGSVAFSPDGTMLAAGYYDGTVRLWDLATRAQVGGAITAGNGSGDGGGDGAPVDALRFSPDGSLLLSAGTDYTVTPWEVWRYSDPSSALSDVAGLSGAAAAGR